MPGANLPGKTACPNPNTEGYINLNTSIHSLFTNAVYHALKKEGPFTLTQHAEGVQA